MKFKSFIMALAALMIVTPQASAATITTADGVLAIETPAENWIQTKDPGHWLVLTDGKNTISVDHLRNGESLPSIDVPNGTNEALYQAFIATKNEIFVVKALAASQEELGKLTEIIGTIKVLKYGTKTAIQRAEPVTAASEVGLRSISGTYYVTANQLNIRSSYNTDASVIGVLKKGDPVAVTGAVTWNGADNGWYQVQFNGTTGYASSSYLSAQAPEAGASTSTANTPASDKYPIGPGFQIVDANGNYMGFLIPYSNGYYYTEGEMAPYADDGEGNYYGGIGEGKTVYAMIQCEYCGAWFLPGGQDYRLHVLDVHPEASDAYAGDDMVLCEYCGEWFHAGNDYRNHVLAAHQNNDASDDYYEEDSDLVECEFCGELLHAGAEYRGHVFAMHADAFYDETEQDDDEDWYDEEYDESDDYTNDGEYYG